MADPPAAAPAGVAMSGQDVLLATKLHVPRPQPGFVPRPRLVQALGEGLARGRVLVCAPAGFGKTSLLADWARGGGRPVAWLGLDAGDNDPARFWRYVVAALDQAQPGIAGRLGPLLGPPAPRSFEGLVTALINELAAQPGRDEVLLVLDDYHLVDAGPVHESVAFLLENLPPGLLLVVSGRADPPLPLARLRARGQLAELRAAELRFTTEEAAALLGAAAGPVLPDTAVVALTARTEGWAAGLQLAALSLRGARMRPGSSRRSAVATASCWTTWLMRSSTASPGRCARSCWRPRCWSGCPASCVTRSPAGPAARRCCTTSSGRACSWCRWMRCAAGGATTTCSPICSAPAWQAEQPGRVLELHRAAAAWSDEHDLADDAVRHALAAGDAAWAARLVERYVEALLRRSEGVTLRRWLSTLPAEVLRARPRLCLAQGFNAVVSGQVEAIEPLLDDAERAFAATGGQPPEPPVGRAGGVLANVPAGIAFLRAELARLRGDAARAVDWDRQARAQLGESDYFLRTLVARQPGRGGLAARPARAG